eukprot:3748538-Rhodomonas_salina.1
MKTRTVLGVARSVSASTVVFRLPLLYPGTLQGPIQGWGTFSPTAFRLLPSKRTRVLKRKTTVWPHPYAYGKWIPGNS